MDYRGYGDSGGTPYTKLTLPEQREVGQKWPGDVDVAFDYLVSQPGVRRDAIGAGGASCGVNQSIQLSRRHPEVKSWCCSRATPTAMAASTCGGDDAPAPARGRGR
jgi:hypothetical protein